MTTSGNSATISGTGTILGPFDVSNALTGYACGQLVGSFSGTLQLQGSLDGGTTYVALQVVNMNAGTSATDITAAGIYRGDVGGITKHRWQCTAYSSGTPTLTANVRIG